VGVGTSDTETVDGDTSCAILRERLRLDWHLEAELVPLDYAEVSILWRIFLA
jgi:hypothetical protein